MNLEKREGAISFGPDFKILLKPQNSQLSSSGLKYTKSCQKSFYDSNFLKTFTVSFSVVLFHVHHMKYHALFVLTLYCMMTPSIYYVFENMEKGVFAPFEHILHFP